MVLRIEDTDAERGRQEWLDGIISAMAWLGLDADEGPFRQSDAEPAIEPWLMRSTKPAISMRASAPDQRSTSELSRTRRQATTVTVEIVA